MSQTLYRKYRPQSFDDVIGQEPIKMILREEIKSGRVAHAYLFTGPRGVGKTTMARLLAKAVNCQKRGDGESEACGECQTCREVTDGNCLDLIEIDAASNRRIDDIREVRERVKFAPVKCKYKVFIIDEVHMLTPEAFNALLKTLEEPPKHAIFILATTEIHKVPETIISRCQRFDFKRVDFKEIVKKLNRMVEAEGLKAEKEVLRAIAYYSEGHPRDAESLLAQILPLAGEDKMLGLAQLQVVLPAAELEAVLGFLEQAMSGQMAAAITGVNELVEKGADLKNFVDECVDLIRKIILIKNNLGDLGLQLEANWEERIKKMAGLAEVGRWLDLARLLTEAKRELDWYQIQQMPIELAVLEFARSENENGESESREVGGGGGTAVKAEVSAGAVVEKPMEARVNEAAEEKPVEKEEKAEKDEIESSPADEVGEVVAEVEVGEVSEAAVEVQDKPELDAKVNLSLYDIKNKWSQVMTLAGESNRALVVLLQVAEILEVNGIKIRLAVPYKFYLDKLKEIKSQEILHQSLKQVFGVSLILEAVCEPKLAKDAEAVKQAQTDSQPVEVKNLLQSFGGEVVG